MATWRLPSAPICPDIKELSTEWLRNHSAPRGMIDLLVGGFPCVGFSLLGKQEGFKEAQSGLFSHMLRLVDELMPALVFVENVPAVLKLGMSQDNILCLCVHCTCATNYLLRLVADCTGAVNYDEEERRQKKKFKPGQENKTTSELKADGGEYCGRGGVL